MAEEKVKCGLRISQPWEDEEYCGIEKHGPAKDFCIFHAPIEEKSEVSFWEEFEAYVSRHERTSKKLFQERGEHLTLDCRKFVFPKQEKRFEEREFITDIDFTGAVFYGDTSFDHSSFLGEVTFWGATFKANASFGFTRFAKSVIFFDADFDERGSFYDVKINGKLSFSLAKFGGNARFTDIEVTDGVDFHIAEFSGSAHLNAFGTEIVRDEFYKVTSIKPIEGDFRNVSIEEHKKLIIKNIDLGDWAFANTPRIADADFNDVSWRGKTNIKRNHTRDELLALNRVITFEAATEVYRRLRKNFESELAYSEAGDFHIGEMHMRRLGLRQKGWKRLFNLTWLFLHLYRIFGGYGERIRNPIISFFAVGLAFAGLWSLLGFPIPVGENVVISHNLGYAILFSFKTFFTLPGRAFCLVQELVGAFQRAIGVGIITLFILALRRAFRR